MLHGTKIGVIVRDDLLAWQELNVTAFLSSGIAAAYPDCIGKQYVDAASKEFLPIFAQPVFVYAASKDHLHRTLKRAESREVKCSVYAAGMFKTNNDNDNRAVVMSSDADSMDIVGLAFRASSKEFDKITSGLKLHP